MLIRKKFYNTQKNFYESFVQDGFIVKGETLQELDDADTGFSYQQKNPVTVREDFSPVIHRAGSDTQKFLESFLLNLFL